MSNRLNKEREAKLQPKRHKSCKKKLEQLGYEVEGVGETTLMFVHNGNVITLFPYSGWFTGKGIKDGRGFNKLLKQLKQ